MVTNLRAAHFVRTAASHTALCLCSCQRGSWAPTMRTQECLLHHECPCIRVLLAWGLTAYFWALCLWKGNIIAQLYLLGVSVNFLLPWSRLIIRSNVQKIMFIVAYGSRQRVHRDQEVWLKHETERTHLQHQQKQRDWTNSQTIWSSRRRKNKMWMLQSLLEGRIKYSW